MGQDTQQIERAIGMIEVGYGALSRNDGVKVNAKANAQRGLQISITSEKEQRTLFKSAPSPSKNQNQKQLGVQVERVVVEKEERTEKSPPKPKMKAQSAKAKPQQKSKHLKLKRSFRARTSKNRLQFSLLASPNKEREDASEKRTSLRDEHESRSRPKPRISDGKIKSLNDFDDVNPTTTITKAVSHVNDESSEDEFDF